MSTSPSETDSVVDTGWHRLSPRMLLVHPVIEFGRAMPALFGLFIASRGSAQGSIWGAAAVGLVTGIALVRWVTTRFRITAEHIQLRRGLLRRATIAAPLDRVRTVDVTAHLLHRALGLAKVVVGAGTSDRKGRDRLVLDGLTAAAAARLRVELLHRRHGAALDTAPPATAVEHEIVRLKGAWVRYAPFTMSGAVTGLALLGFGSRFASEANINLGRLGPLRGVADLLQRSPVTLDVAVIVAMAVVFVAAASTIGYVLAYWAFRLTRHSGGSLHVTRGLLTSRATSIERRRLQASRSASPCCCAGPGRPGAPPSPRGCTSGAGAIAAPVCCCPQPRARWRCEWPPRCSTPAHRSPWGCAATGPWPGAGA